MEPEALLTAKVAQLRRRLRLLVTQRWVALALTYAAGAACLLAVVAKLRWAPGAVDWIGALLLAGAVVGFAVGWTRTVTPLAAAQLADERLDLKERLSSGVLLAGIAARDEMAAAQLADAVERARAVRPAAAFPWRLPRQARWLAATFGLLFAILYLPELPFFHSARERAEQAAMADTGRQYQAIARELERQRANDPSHDAILRRVAQNLKQLGRDQERGRLSKKEALLRANELQRATKEAERQLGVPAGSKSLEEAAADLQRAADRQSRGGNSAGARFAGGARQLQQMSEALANGDVAAAQRALDALGKDLQQRANEGKVSPEELRRAAEAMRQAADAVTGSRAEAAAKKLREGAGDLEKAAGQAEKLRAALARAQTPQERAALQNQIRSVTRDGMCAAGT